MRGVQTFMKPFSRWDVHGSVGDTFSSFVRDS
jgi:hypothetical protein